MTVLILGSQGNVGSQLLKIIPDAIGWNRDDVDITNTDQLREKIEDFGTDIDVIINCVAYNDVDGAESNQDATFLLNETVPAQLSEMANNLGAILVHYSTGYVFDGTQDSYDETATPHPLSVYAESKYAGETEVQKIAQKYYLIRTNVVFGPAGTGKTSKKSFVDIMLALSEKTNEIKAVDTEINSITYAPDLAKATWDIIETGSPFGVYHITNDGYASWYEFAKEIFKITLRPISLIPVPSDAFPRPAVRPARIVLSNTKLQKLRPWQEALQEYLSL